MLEFGNFGDEIFFKGCRLLGSIPNLQYFYYEGSELTKMHLEARMLTLIDRCVVTHMSYYFTVFM